MEEEKEKSAKERRANIPVYMLESEKNLLDNLALVLHQRGYINSANRSEAARYCIRAISYLLFKEIEQERYGGGEGEH